jgi:hypothetical protein
MSKLAGDLVNVPRQLMGLEPFKATPVVPLHGFKTVYVGKALPTGNFIGLRTLENPKTQTELASTKYPFSGIHGCEGWAIE